MYIKCDCHGIRQMRAVALLARLEFASVSKRQHLDADTLNTEDYNDDHQDQKQHRSCHRDTDDRQL